MPYAMQNTPDAYFWYSLTIVMALAIIWILVRYTGKVDETLKELKQAVNELITSNKVHNIRLDGHDNAIEEIKEQYTVKYKR